MERTPAVDRAGVKRQVCADGQTAENTRRHCCGFTQGQPHKSVPSFLHKYTTYHAAASIFTNNICKPNPYLYLSYFLNIWDAMRES